jgi:hypothetical protein
MPQAESMLLLQFPDGGSHLRLSVEDLIHQNIQPTIVK